MDEGPLGDLDLWAVSVFVSLGLVLVGFLVWAMVLALMDPKGRWVIYGLAAFVVLVCIVRLFIWWWGAGQRWFARHWAPRARGAEGTPSEGD